MKLFSCSAFSLWYVGTFFRHVTIQYKFSLRKSARRRSPERPRRRWRLIFKLVREKNWRGGADALVWLGLGTEALINHRFG